MENVPRSGGPMNDARNSSEGQGLPSWSRACLMHETIPGLGSVRVPSRSNNIEGAVNRFLRELFL